MSSIPKKELLVLEILAASGPMHGLGLVTESGEALKRGTVYVTLGRMEAKGFVMSEQEPSHPGAIGLPRRIYRTKKYTVIVHATTMTIPRTTVPGTRRATAAPA